MLLNTEQYWLLHLLAVPSCLSQELGIVSIALQGIQKICPIAPLHVTEAVKKPFFSSSSHETRRKKGVLF